MNATVSVFVGFVAFFLALIIVVIIVEVLVDANDEKTVEDEDDDEQILADEVKDGVGDEVVAYHGVNTHRSVGTILSENREDERPDFRREDDAQHSALLLLVTLFLLGGGELVSILRLVKNDGDFLDAFSGRQHEEEREKAEGPRHHDDVGHQVRT